MSAPEPLVELAETVVDIVKTHRKHPTVPMVASELRDAFAMQYELGRTEALREVDIWLGPVLEQLELETGQPVRETLD